MRFYTLDAMRGIAAIAVVILHIGLWMRLPMPPYAYLAVDCFFMLSGFVLTRSYEERLRSTLTVGRFMQMRVIRLYPLFLVGAALGSGGLIVQTLIQSEHALGVTETAAAILTNIVMLPDPLSSVPYPTNPPGWSLIYELLANVVFAGFFVRVGTRSLGLLWFVVAAIFLPAIFSEGSASFGTKWTDIPFGILRVCYSFILGSIFGRLFNETSRHESPASVILLLIFATILFANFSSAPMFASLVLVFFFPALIWFCARCELPVRLQGVGKGLGDMSYALYALHFPALVFFYSVLKRLELPAIPSAIAFLVIAIILSWAVAHYWDEPFRRFLKNRLRRRPASSIPEVAII